MIAIKKLYICNTYYHLMISIIKSLLDVNNESDVVISTDRTNRSLFQDKDLINRIKNANVFKKIYIFDHSKEEARVEKKSILKFIYTLKETFFNKEIDFKIYDDINIFFEKCLIGRIINQRGIKYNLIEDGTDSLKNNYENIKYIPTIKNRIKKKLGFSFIGDSKNIKSIEVNNADGLKFNKSLIKEFPRKKLFSMLTSKEKKILLDIFLPNGIIDYNVFNNSIVLLTQPLYEDNHLTYEKHILLYKDIINKYSNDNIIIKKHPREKINYEDIFPNCIIIDYPFPIEILNFLNFKIKKVITVSSTAINLLDNVDKKEYLGWKHLDKYK